MKRLLISSYALSPLRGSECAVGWEITKRFGKYFHVTVLMCEKSPSGNEYYNEVQAYLKENGKIGNVEYIPVPMPENSKKYTKLHDLGFWPAYYWGYNCWQRKALQVAIEFHKQNKFDAAYHLNMIGFREPGYLWKLNIPFYWGPTNGFHSIPFPFINGFKGKEFVLQSLKHIANELQIKISTRAKKVAKIARVVWCVDQSALKQMQEWGANAHIMQETGLSGLPLGSVIPRFYDGKRTLNIVWSGMITTGKALHILIDALLKNPKLNYHLTVVGAGPLQGSLEKRSEPIKDKITWTGWVNKSEAVQIVNKSDVLIHTSLKEGTPHVILEALSFGVPVICHDTCGMGSVINDKNGLKIPYINYTTSVNSLNQIISSIFDNPQLLNDLYNSILETTTHLTWDKKVEKLALTIGSQLNS